MANDWDQVTARGFYPSGSETELPAAPADVPNEAQVEVCRAWLKEHARPTKTIRKKFSSYHWKHVVERLAEGRYIQNGAFIKAAELEGYRMERSAEGSLNAHFNFSLKPKRWFVSCYPDLLGDRLRLEASTPEEARKEALPRLRQRLKDLLNAFNVIVHPTAPKKRIKK